MPSKLPSDSPASSNAAASGASSPLATSAGSKEAERSASHSATGDSTGSGDKTSADDTRAATATAAATGATRDSGGGGGGDLDTAGVTLAGTFADTADYTCVVSNYSAIAWRLTLLLSFVQHRHGPSGLHARAEFDDPAHRGLHLAGRDFCGPERDDLSVSGGRANVPRTMLTHHTLAGEMVRLLGADLFTPAPLLILLPIARAVSWYYVSSPKCSTAAG